MNVHNCWFSARVAPLLKKAGASDWGTVVGMEAPLHAFSSMKSSDISDINLEIRLVSLNSDDSTIQAYYTLLATAFLEGEELPHNMSQEQYENELAALSKRAFWDNRINRPEWKRWIGFVDGKPAATVALWNRWAHLGVTTLMDVTVAEQYRRRGIAKRMITHALTDISGLAGPYHKCILQAEPDAVPVYLSLGFKPTCEISVWEFDTDDT
jgi:GNAT superfamily N-acetyltransferase